MKIEDIYKIFIANNNIISTDSRNIQEGCIFFALKGGNFNGNKYASEAINQGAAIAIVDEQEYSNNKQCVLVKDVLTCLQQLANFHRKKLAIPILAITGTNGKTTSKELINAVISSKYKCIATKGNLNNHIGVPLSLLSMNSETEFGIIEMGANHPGEISILCNIAEPDYGVITNVGKAHLEGFGSLEGVKRTKKELYDYISHKGGTIFINSGNDHLKDMISDYKNIVYYGSTKECFCKANYLQASPYMVFELISNTGKLYVKTKLFGKYNFENALLSACVGKYLDIDIIIVKNALEKYTPSNNRSQLKKTNKNTIFLDAYNANPSSMLLAIENFKEMQGTNKTYILGDMLELGTDSDKEHIEIINILEKEKDCNIILVGKIFSKLNTHLLSFNNVDELKEYIIKEPIQNHKILIKGSRGIALEKCIDLL